jgi:Tol biopolymer transport system component
VSSRRGAAAIAAAALLAGGVAAGHAPRTIHVGYRQQMFVVSADGGARRLTGGDVQHAGGIWSRRGQRIAVDADRRVEIRDLRGKVKHVIEPGGGVSWSPDDRHVALVRLHRPKGRDRYVGNLVVTDLDGGHRRFLATGVSTAIWAPRGRTIYYLRGDLGYKPQTLWSVRSDGRDRRRLAKSLAYFSGVAPSPDGSYLLFLRYNRSTFHGSTWVMRADGRGQRKLMEGTPSSGAWAPGGRSVYGPRRHGHPVVISLSGHRRVLRARVRGRYYSWSPDGRRLAWVSERYNRTLVLSVRPDGTDRRVLARFTSLSSLTEIGPPEWSPDGHRLLVSPFRHEGD